MIEYVSSGAFWASNPAAVSHVYCPQSHPVAEWASHWVAQQPYAKLVHSVEDLTGGDYLFLLSCSEIITPEIRAGYRFSMVVHAGDLPRDRGWSPHVWSIIEGARELVVTLLDCADPVDSGNIWHQQRIALNGTETYDEINEMLFAAEIRLLDWAVQFADSSESKPQVGKPSYRRRRTPADSEVKPSQRLDEIFDLVRVCDPDRFPAFFTYRGEKFALTIKHLD